MLSRAEAIAFREQTRALAMQIGLRPAARALGLSEDRVRKWGQRYNWQISLIRPPLTGYYPPTSPNDPKPLDVMANVMALEGDRTRSAMARTARRAFEHADHVSEEALHELPRGVALEKHAKIAQIAHGWNQAQANVAVQVNVPMPTDEERREMRSIDAKLDAIAAKLK